jgi:hypothetical protein
MLYDAERAREASEDRSDPINPHSRKETEMHGHAAMTKASDGSLLTPCTWFSPAISRDCENCRVKQITKNKEKLQKAYSLNFVVDSSPVCRIQP